jgi:DNA-binding transcriptional regulator YiaG
MTGKQIVALRKALNITQAQLAEKLGAARETVARWETDRFKPHRLYLQQLEKLRAEAKRKNKNYKG